MQTGCESSQVQHFGSREVDGIVYKVREREAEKAGLGKKLKNSSFSRCIFVIVLGRDLRTTLGNETVEEQASSL